MFYWIYLEFQRQFNPLRVFKYVPFRTIAAVITALVITMILYPWYINRLTRRRIGETIRNDGPQAHLKKSGTPTMGGSLMLIALVISTLLWSNLQNEYVWFLLSITFGMGVIGFVDDFRKFKKSKGISGKTKLLLQFLVTGVCVLVFYWYHPASLSAELSIPFVRTAIHEVKISDPAGVALPFVTRFDANALTLPLWLLIPFVMVVIVGTSNAVNLTDGLDGLAIGPVIIASGTFLILMYIGGASFLGRSMADYLRVPKIDGAYELAVVCGAMIGVGIGFLWYNTYPAQVFMGDVGSLSLGGALGTLAVLSGHTLLSVIVLGIFLTEAVSVITQTVSYKLTGKRVFRMAPIHHHFELKGWAEPKIIVRFWIIAIFLALIALSSLKLR